MFLRVKCSNGHSLKVPHKFAGQEGVCPICKEKVSIPPLERQDVSEDAILDVISTAPTSTISRYAASREDLTPQNTEGGEPAGKDNVLFDEPSNASEDSSLLKIRRCPQCERRVPPNYHICPNCSTYLTEDSHIDEKKATTACPTCGAPSFPGADVCQQCGTQLFLRE